MFVFFNYSLFLFVPYKSYLFFICKCGYIRYLLTIIRPVLIKTFNWLSFPTIQSVNQTESSCRAISTLITSNKCHAQCRYKNWTRCWWWLPALIIGRWWDYFVGLEIDFVCKTRPSCCSFSNTRWMRGDYSNAQDWRPHF